jgi:mono/diheme cytochrome c family protein
MFVGNSAQMANIRMKRNFAVRKFMFVVVLALIGFAISNVVDQNRKWVIPEEARKVVNPLPSSTANLEAGKTIYAHKCAECHGDTGKGDGPKARTHWPASADLTDSSRMNSLLDGEIFYAISEGKRPMPAFKKRLTEEERWQLVQAVRAFSGAPSTGQRPAER